MRNSSYVPLRDLGLTEEELAYLQPKAAAIFDKFVKSSRYEPDKEGKKSFSDFLDRPDVKKLLEQDPRKVMGIKVIHGIVHPSATATAGKTRTLKTEIHEVTGFGLKHSSYGGIRIGSPSGAEWMLVGSPSLGGYCKSIGFTSGRISIVEDNDCEPNMYTGGIELIELIMSMEQYCMFVRGNKGILTPCGMSRDGKFADESPALTHVQSSQRDLKREINVAAQPLVAKVQAFVKMLEQGASKKSDYADLVTAASEAHESFKAVADEIVGIVKTAGVKVGDIAKRQFEADMTDRMGQLKLGSELNALVRGLSHDSGMNDDQNE